MSNTRLYAVTFVVGLGQFTTGMYVGWPSLVTPKLNVNGSSFKITTDEFSWLASLFKLGMAFGCFLSIFVVDYVGRKISMLLTIVPTVSSWLLIALSPSVPNLYLAKFIGGTASGIIFTSGSIYVTETSPANIRGSLCSCFVLMDYWGNLLGYLAGLFGTVQQYCYAAISLAILQFVLFVWLPETPYYLLHRKRFAAAMDSLTFLRGSADIAEEMDTIMRSVEHNILDNGILSPVFRLISQPDGKCLICIGAGVMTAQALSGSGILIGYAQTVFEKIHDAHLQTSYTCIVLAMMQLISYVFCISLVDSLGRKPLMIVSTVGVTACSFLLGVYFCMEYNAAQATNLQVLPFAALLFYVVSLSLGLVGVPFVVMNEIFPTYARGTCVGFCFCINFTWSFIMLRIWSFAAFQRSVYAAFWFISALNVFSVVFLIFYLPETKRKSFLELRDNTVCSARK